MTTLVQIADRAQVALNDTGVGTWPQATVEAWIVDAIRDYSQIHPRTKTVSATIAVDDVGHEFTLPTDYIATRIVECPTGEDPPAYLRLRPRTHDQFFDYEGYYDVEPSHDAASAGVLYLSEEPANGDTYSLTYTAAHDTSLDSGDTITVREDHESILILFVIWQAFKERAATQITDPDTTTDLLQKLTNAAAQAEQEYRRALKLAEQHRADSAWTGPWTSDTHDRIY